MASPRRVSARKNTTTTARGSNTSTSSANTIPKGQNKASLRDSGAAMISPINAETILEDRSSDVDFVGLAASTSTVALKGKSQMNGTSATSGVKTAGLAVATRSSSEELTDLEELDKALKPATKQVVQRKRKSKGKETASQSDSANAEAEKDTATEVKTKVKKKRTQKIQGPYLPTVNYPERNLGCK